MVKILTDVRQHIRQPVLVILLENIEREILTISILYSGRVNFWRLVARHAIGGEKFGESSTTGLSCVAYTVMFKNLAGKFLARLDKSAKIFHHQNFVLYGISPIKKQYIRNVNLAAIKQCVIKMLFQRQPSCIKMYVRRKTLCLGNWRCLRETSEH